MQLLCNCDGECVCGDGVSDAASSPRRRSGRGLRAPTNRRAKGGALTPEAPHTISITFGNVSTRGGGGTDRDRCPEAASRPSHPFGAAARRRDGGDGAGGRAGEAASAPRPSVGPRSRRLTRTVVAPSPRPWRLSNGPSQCGGRLGKGWPRLTAANGLSQCGGRGRGSRVAGRPGQQVFAAPGSGHRPGTAPARPQRAQQRRLRAVLADRHTRPGPGLATPEPGIAADY